MNRLADSTEAETQTIKCRHLIIGWSGLLIFLTFGTVLETLHGFKSGYYLDGANHTRRLMWTLCHSHGTLFSLVHIAFAVSLGLLSVPVRRIRWTSIGLTAGLLCLPTGFFAGGLRIHGDDPGIGILLVPVGAVCMLIAVGNLVLAITSRSGVSQKSTTSRRTSAK